MSCNGVCVEKMIHEQNVRMFCFDRKFHLYVIIFHEIMNHVENSGVTTCAVALFCGGGPVSTIKRNSDLDRYDVAILSALATNTRLTTVELATKVHLSRTAVSRRITSLKRSRVLNDAAEVLNYAPLGFGVRAVVEIKSPSQVAQVLRKRLLVQPEVLSVAVIGGDGLLSLDVIAVDMDHLQSFIHTLQNSGETSTKVIFAEDKSELTLVQRMRMLNERIGNGLVRV
jgi:Lrp/AsnC family leucine-responsive transcriptional regulator